MAGAPMILKQKSVRDARFLVQAKPYEWLVALPFLAVHAALVYSSFYVDAVKDLLGASLLEEYHVRDRHISGLMMLGVPALLVVQVVICLFCYWNARLRAFVFFKKTSSVLQATHIILLKKPNSGNDQIIPLAIAHEGDAKSFPFMSRLYKWDTAAECFKKPALPTKLRIADYKAIRGKGAAAQGSSLWWRQHLSGPSVTAASDRARALVAYGTNKFHVPLPEFKELMIEHATSPFFVFQMLCVVLWLLDEYWYAALITGVMLWVFEGTVVQQRIKSMDHLREIESPLVRVPVLREAATAASAASWEMMTSDQLLPGDVVLLQRTLTNATLPADILVLEGSVIVNESMLTGESTPVMKESIDTRDGEERLDLKNPDYKMHSLFSGTKLLQIAKPSSADSRFPAACAGGAGAVGVVLRTGFETSQGSLIRKIVTTSTSRVVGGGSEAFMFIGVLLSVSLFASGYVLHHGLQDPNRSRWKLLLSCTIIITSVVPPELPMELAMAVNVSLLTLHKLKIFCSEPFKIPFAGALDTCCFDKTGTLTADVMEFAGAAESELLTPDAGTRLLEADKLSVEAQLVLCGCHSVVYLDGKDKPPAGDSMEAAALTALGWGVTDAATGSSTFQKKGTTLCILNRYVFSSTLQRMSAVLSVTGLKQTGRESAFTGPGAGARVLVVSKGSPESMRMVLREESIPANYDETCREFGRDGFRVIALAMKPLAQDAAYAKKLKRADAEQGLSFVGFAVFRCPVREDAVPTVAALQKANQNVVMITGDHQLTAAWVAEKVGITAKPRLFLQADGTWCFDDGKEMPSTEVSTDKFDLVVSGVTLRELDDPTWLPKWVTSVKVWARCNPAQKEDIVLELKKQGKTTLMCGDGTNDVGALTMAHVGVGLLAGCASAKPIKVERSGPPPHPLSVPEPLPEDMGIISILKWRLRENKRQKDYYAHLRQEMLENPGARRHHRPSLPPGVPEDMEGEGLYAPVVQIGDASLAAPFTARNSSTQSCCHLLRLGRCTLATTMQMYKIMALNCLTTAFALSVLAHERVKYSDTQMTVISTIAALCFLATSRGVPLPDLSTKNPHKSVFAPCIVLTIATQFALHFYHLLATRQLVVDELAAYSIDNATELGYNATMILPDKDAAFDDAQFHPCLLNTLTLLISTWQVVLIFLVNYQGTPFKTSLASNTTLVWSLVILSAFVAECTLQLTPAAAWLEVVDLALFPQAKAGLISLIFTNAVSVIAVDSVLKLVLG